MWSLLFSDDNKVAASLDTNEDRGKIQTTLDAVYKWVAENDMTINASKTYCMRVGRLQIGEGRYLAPGGESIEYVVEMKDLRVLMDS